MKKIILFVLIFTFSYSPVILSIINPIDKTIEFKDGEAHQFIDVIINDDDNWEPDEDFLV